MLMTMMHGDYQGHHTGKHALRHYEGNIDDTLCTHYGAKTAGVHVMIMQM